MILKKIFTLLFVTAVAAAYLLLNSFQEPVYEIYHSAPADKQSITEFSVEVVLMRLGEKAPQHFISKAHADSVKMGEELVRYGKLADPKTKPLSKHFVCINCHNTSKEIADPGNLSPDSLLSYSVNNQVPYLPGSGFYGLYNKRNWFQGDFSGLYAVDPLGAKDTLSQAIQYCNQHHAKGRVMEHWEIRSILHYIKSLELKMGDLVFTNFELNLLGKTIVNDHAMAREIIHSRYKESTKASFKIADQALWEKHIPQTQRGEMIYTQACMHCHAKNSKISSIQLTKNSKAFKSISTQINSDPVSFMRFIRQGKVAEPTRKKVMPPYSLQRLSDEQLFDLMSYIRN